MMTTATTFLLGPQRFTTTVAPTVRSLDVAGPIAMINSGWEEREEDDSELASHLDGRGVNLRLYQRSVELLAADRALRVAVLDHRARLDDLRGYYGIRLQSAWDAVFAVEHRTSSAGLGDSALRSALQAVRDVDDWYSYEVARQREVTAALDVVRDSVGLARHRAEIAELIAGAGAVVLAGGHVGILMQTLQFFEVAVPAATPVVAWSAGAMAVCDPIVLFHDFVPHGVSAPEVHDRGLGRVLGILPLPHARRRLDLAQPERLAAFARRFPKHALVPLDDGTIVRLGPGQTEPPAGTRVVTRHGTMALWGTP